MTKGETDRLEEDGRPHLAGHGAGERTRWWRGATVYQIYPRSFRDTTGNGVGDLQGIIDGLPYLASLGVDAIWLSPFFRSPMKDYGYDVSDYCDVDPLFGSLSDFDRLIEKAHALGLKIIVDQVYAHTSDAHAWFSESRKDRTNPKADWYVWADAMPDGAPPNNWQAVFGGSSWEWDARRQQYYLHNFLVSQPQLNVHNQQVQDALLAVARFWLDRGVDGFRLDAINFAMHDRLLRDNPPSGLPMELVSRPFDMQQHLHNMSQPEVPGFLERVRGLLDQYGGKFTVAEVVGADPIDEMKRFTQDETRLNSAYNFDFLYARTIAPGLVRESLSQWDGSPGEGWPSWAFANHDAPRAVSRWMKPEVRKQAAQMLVMLLLSLRGNAFIYQGEELGLPQAHVPFESLRDPEAIANWPRTLGRDGARTPMPWTYGAVNSGFSTGEAWLPVDPQHDALAVDQQETDPASTLNVTRALIAIRQECPALRRGSLRFLKMPDPLLVFERVYEGDVITCVFNMSEQPSPFSWEWTKAARVIATQNGAALGTDSLPGLLEPWSGYWVKDSMAEACDEAADGSEAIQIHKAMRRKVLPS